MLNLPMKDLNTYRAEQQSQHYIFRIPPGTPLSACQSSDYWVHVRNRLRLLDVVELIADDGSFEAKMRILEINRATGNIVFRTLSEWRPAPSETVMPLKAETKPKFKAAWIVGNRSYSVQEIQTGNYVAEGLTKENAEKEADRLNAERLAA